MDQLVQQARAMMTSLGPKRLAAYGLVLVAIVVGIVSLANWASRPTWALLATDVEPEAMNAVVDKLKTLKVAYALDPGGRSVRVDATRVDELRMQLAAQGLPASGRIGFELFDQTQFGATELTEKVNFQRALEGELERTISALATVMAARVHLAMPRTSLFATQTEPAKASVVLRLRAGRSVSAPEVDGIVALVASSVEGLEPAAVAVIDANGRQLSRQIDAAEASGDRGRFDRQQKLEHDMAARVVALLEPVVGAGGVRANVSVNLKADSEDELEERWDPTTVVRSKQQSTEADARTAPYGAAGAKANMPAAPADKTKDATASAPLVGSNRSTETTNYEVSKSTRHRVSPAGQLDRLSVAVLVDDAKTVKRNGNGEETVVSTPRTPQELQRLSALVSSAVGLVPDRGDQITVDNISFDMPDAPPLPLAAPVPAPTWQTMRDQLRQQWPVLVAASAMGALVVGGLVYMLRSRRKTTVAGLAAGAPRLATADGAPIAAMPRAAAEPDAPDTPQALPSPARQLARLAQTEPEQLARIVRGWLQEEENK